MGADVAEQTKSKGWCWYLIVFVIGALVVAAATLTILKNFHNSAKPTSIPGAILVNNRIAWRGDSGLRDGGNEENLDLSRGMYDAGDLIKFGFPMAFTATVLSWAILEYGDHMNAVKQLEHAQDSLKWITDYLINAHPSANVLYVQVGDPEVDHNCWERPEAMTEKRPLVKVNMLFPGAEVAAETAAAMASASMVFKKIDFTYSSMLFMHAQQLFILADTYQGSYSVSILQVQKYYNSTGYGDELLWAATWLYHATGKQFYLRYVLLSRINFFGAKDESTSENLDLQLYRESAEAIVCALLPDSPTATSSRTESGLIWVSEWNSLQHPVASAFLAVLYGDYMLTTQTETLYYIGKSYKPEDLHKFAISLADYVLGNNPMKMSYLIGYGSSYPQYAHHRGSSIPVDAKTGCRDGFKWLNSSHPNPNVAVGALVGGPFLNETYNDS
ncbi:endoglucanase 2 [Quercus suber]|uniref:Endoglucanase n=1 Tax=Quercus suber TaxID=58331 RepID=A0AAW0LMH2_QUESU